MGFISLRVPPLRFSCLKPEVLKSFILYSVISARPALLDDILVSVGGKNSSQSVPPMPHYKEGFGWVGYLSKFIVLSPFYSRTCACHIQERGAVSFGLWVNDSSATVACEGLGENFNSGVFGRSSDSWTEKTLLDQVKVTARSLSALNDRGGILVCFIKGRSW